ncbi:MAG: FkbM family methyltransferase [Candidatus Cloacimonetes bacterium]|nr:FkbM family methyltransferase [Candidatus Cloacimonadota bacterium]
MSILKKFPKLHTCHRILKESPLYNNFRIIKHLRKFYRYHNQTDYYHTKFGWTLFDKDNFLKNNLHRIEEIKNILADERSKMIYQGMINLRQTRNAKDYPFHFVKEYQYFLKKMKFTKDEVFIDCGASGITIDTFIKHCPRYKQILAFEPVLKDYERLVVRHGGNPKITLLNKGVYDSECELSFFENKIIDNALHSDSIEIKTQTIDNLELKKVTFIKMDVEGAELQALKGAENTIIRDKPKLAICIYHSCEDMVKIPEYIHNIVPEYKLFIRQYHFVGDTVLYAMI